MYTTKKNSKDCVDISNEAPVTCVIDLLISQEFLQCGFYCNRWPFLAQ